jgi:RNA polymerase sigma-70 factor (ECF subfamily)
VLYEAYKDKVYSIALYYFHGDAGLAADVSQEVFVKAITGIAGFRGSAGIGTWLYRLTANACTDRRRSTSAREVAASPEIFERMASVDSPELRARSAEEASRVRTAVSSLPEKLRLPVLLRYFEDLSYEEMAEALGCSAGTVASRLNKGHQLLREKLR